MKCSICRKNDVGPTVPGRTMRPGTDFCESCYYTGAAAERDLADLLGKIVALTEVEDAAVWHTGGGCFNLAVTLTDGRLLTPSVGHNDGGEVYAEPGLPGVASSEPGDDERWAIVVSESRDAWEEWDEARLFIPQTLWTTEELPDAVAKIARGEIVRPKTDRELAQALRDAEAAKDETATVYALNEIAARLDLDPDETEQGLTPAASEAIDEFEVVEDEPTTGGVRGQGYVGAGLDEKPEAYIVAVVEQGRIVEVLARYEVDAPNAAPDAIWKRDDVRREDEFARRERTVLSLAVRHDCDENPVPYVSDGPLGHGFECGVCGAFLQAG